MSNKHHFSILSNSITDRGNYSQIMILSLHNFSFIKYKEIFDNIPVKEATEEDIYPFNGDINKDRIYTLSLIPSEQYYIELYGTKNPDKYIVYEKNLNENEFLDFIKKYINF